MKRRAKRVAHRVRRGARRVGAAMETRPGKVVMMAIEATAGGVVTSMAVNKFAPAGMSPTTKSLIQGGLGLAAVMFIKNRHVKSAGAGAVIASLMGVAQSLFKVSALSGPSGGSRTLTPSELNRLVTGGMGLPLNPMNMPLSGGVPSGAGFKGGFGS